MKRRKTKTIRGQSSEEGFVIVLVAGGLLVVMGAIAMLAIDAVTFYAARSEAQLAADGAALAGARVMANSGSTSNPIDLQDLAENLASTTATQVAAQNKVGGRNLDPATEVVVSFPASPGNNPRVKVQITRNDLPTFFARMWGRTQVTVTASATAEAYNPSGIGVSANPVLPIAPVCVKPWLLPNLDPTKDTATAGPIFDRFSGAIVNPGLVGQGWPNTGANANTSGLVAKCGSCTAGSLPPEAPGQYYPAAIDSLDPPLDPLAFPVPRRSLPACSGGLTDYQLAVAGCVEKPIACGATATINIDTNIYVFHTTDRDADTVEAGKCLIHDKGAAGETDSIDPAWTQGEPFQFLAGTANPIAGAVGKDVLVSDSLVTVPVFDSSPVWSQPVQVIGFLQLFLNPQGTPLAGTQIPVTIVNMAGCGTTLNGQAVLGTGASAIPVRLVAAQ